MDQTTTQPVAAPALAAAAPSQPTESVDAYLDTIFKSSSSDVAQPTTAPVVPTQVSSQPLAPAQTAPLTAPVTAPFAPAPMVNGQPVAAPPENPLPAGVRQRLSELSARAHQAETERQQLAQQNAEMRGYFAALQQQGQQVQRPQEPDIITQPKEYAAWVRDQALSEARAMVAQERQAIEQQLLPQVQQATVQAAKAAWQTDRMRAVEAYGAEAVSAIEAEMQANPRMGDAYSYDQSGRPVANPYTRAIGDRQMRQLQQAIPNGDLKAYEQQVIQRYLQNPAALNQVASQQALQQRQAYPASPQPLASLPTGGSQLETMPADPNDSLRQMFARQRQERMQRTMGVRR